MKLLDDVWGKKKKYYSAPPSLHVTMLTDPDFTQALSASHRHPVCGSCDRPEWLPSHQQYTGGLIISAVGGLTNQCADRSAENNSHQ